MHASLVSRRDYTSLWSAQTLFQMCSSTSEGSESDSFLTCSSDGSVRVWTSDAVRCRSVRSNVSPAAERECGDDERWRDSELSQDLHHVFYTEDSAALLDAEGSSGIRSICVSPDGRHLASGDRHGTLRFHIYFISIFLWDPGAQNHSWDLCIIWKLNK